MSNQSVSEYEKNVFINCPFDKEYNSLLRPLLFTVTYLGYNPKIALERSDSGESRFSKICELIKDSKYSIHDLSRLKVGNKDGFCRLNMAFELGIDFGYKQSSSNRLADKKFLILEKNKHQYKKAISDLSGFDIKNHNNVPIKMVQQVRNWFVETIGLRKILGPTGIWNRFNDFMSDFYDKRKNEGFSNEDLSMMPIPEFINYIKKWCLLYRED